MVEVDGHYFSNQIHGRLRLERPDSAWMRDGSLIVQGALDLQPGTRVDAGIHAASIWCCLDAEVHGDVTCGAFRTEGRASVHGWIRAENVFLGHEVRIHGGLVTPMNHGQVQCGNNCYVEGLLEAAEFRCGNGLRADAHLRAVRSFVGNDFHWSGRTEVYELLMAGANCTLLGDVYVEKLMTRDSLTVSGGNFGELHTDDRFRCHGSVRCRKLIVDNNPYIGGSIEASEYIRFGDSAVIHGNVYCGGLVEKGPGLHIEGSSNASAWRDIPSSHDKRR